MPIYPKEYINSHAYRKTEPKNNCFVLMPFASSFDDVYYSIRNACESPDVLMSCTRADDFYGAGHIMEDILGGILWSEYIVADLTGKNPNVFYELGIAHSCKEPSKVIIITQTLEDVPFDLRHMRCIVYRNDRAGHRHLEQDLQRALLSDSKNIYRFVVEEGSSYDFTNRLTGLNRNFYKFTLSDLHVGRGVAKFSLQVHRESLDEGNATLDRTYHYIEDDEPVEIVPTEWQIRLDRTEHSRAFFSVIPRSKTKG